jgi:hypothetical protein
MMRIMLRRALIACALALLALEAGAASIVPPQDLGELARTSEAVVLAQAGAPRVSQHGPLLFTLTTFRVLEVAAGPLQRGDRVTVEAPGGELDGLAWLVAGAPHFEPGQVYLLFLSQKATGEWLPQVMSYGMLRRVLGRDGTTLLEPLDDAYGLDVFPRPDGILPETVQTYREAALLPHLGAVAAGAAWDAGQVLARADQLPLTASALQAPAGCAYLGNSPYPRWPYNTASSPGQVTIYAQSSGDPSYPGGASGAITAVQNAVGAPDGWMGIPNTSLNLASGSKPYTLTCSGNCKTSDTPPLYIPCAGDNVVVFNDPCGQITDLSGCTGTLAFGGPYTGGTHVLPSDGSTWSTIWSLFVIVNNGAAPCLGTLGYTQMLTHEIGHGLGYDHPPNSYSSVMHYMCCQPVSTFDQGCTQYTYPAVLPTATPTATPTPGPPTPTPTATPTLAPPQPPTGVSASKGAYTDRVRVTWISSTGATRYGVWRYTSNNPVSAQLLDLPVLTVYDDLLATPGATYWYWVTAHNNAGDSAFSSPDSGYAAVPTPTPTLTPTVTPTATRTPTATPTATRTNTPAIFYASFTFTPPAPAVGGTVQFTDASNGATSWQWTFGDGGTSTAKSPSHTFGQVGAFTATLQAGNGVTNATASKTVTVYEQARRHLSR